MNTYMCTPVHLHEEPSGRRQMSSITCYLINLRQSHWATTSQLVWLTSEPPGPAPSSPHPPMLRLQAYITMPGFFVWVLRIWTQVQIICYYFTCTSNLLSHRPSPPSFIFEAKSLAVPGTYLFVWRDWLASKSLGSASPHHCTSLLGEAWSFRHELPHLAF